jgi:hypothetical protein
MNICITVGDLHRDLADIKENFIDETLGPGASLTNRTLRKLILG